MHISFYLPTIAYHKSKTNMKAILKEAQQNVKNAKGMIDYYKKELSATEERLINAESKAHQLEKEYYDILKKLGVDESELEG